MKRVLLILLFLFLLTGAVFSDGIVSESNGHDWNEWSYEFKTGYMFGWLSANDTVWAWMYYTTDAETNEETADSLRMLYEYKNETVDTLIAGINSYYARYPEYMDDEINSIILYNCGKDYWNWDEEVVFHPEEHQGI